MLAVDLPGRNDAGVLTALGTAVAQTPGVATVTPAITSPSGSTAVIRVFPDDRTAGRGDERPARTRLRDDVIPKAVAGTGAQVYVGGFAATADDFAALLAARLPVFIGVVLLLSFLLLMVVFRSLLVPLKAAIMNLLSVGAAYGVVVAIFQWGWGKDLVGVAKEGPIQAFMPMMMFAILFGLSMDYEVFLLSRIREEYLRSGDNATAVADGLAATARVITAAAAIMCTFFLSFVLGDNVDHQAVRHRLRRRDLHRRHPRPPRPRAVDDGAARRRELVAAGLARPDPPPPRRRGARARGGDVRGRGRPERPRRRGLRRYQISMRSAGGRIIGASSARPNASWNASLFENGPRTRRCRGLCGSTWINVRVSSSLIVARHTEAFARKNRCAGVSPSIGAPSGTHPRVGRSREHEPAEIRDVLAEGESTVDVEVIENA